MGLHAPVRLRVRLQVRLRPALVASLSVPLLAAGVLTAPAARADTPVGYGPGSTATPFTGAAFDGCVTPSPAALEAWRRTTSYRAYDAYLSGRSRACKNQPHLTAANLRLNASRGWRAIAIHVGPQAPCSNQRLKLPTRTAYAQGVREADEAVAAAQRLGLLTGSAIYYDMEGYRPSASCTATVLRAMSGWTDRLHARGYLSGVYSSASSGIRDLGRAYLSSAYSRPDAIWVARWDNRPVLTDPALPSYAWVNGQRMKQYRGPVRERNGGVRLSVDANIARTVLSSVAYRYRVTSAGSVRVRTGPKGAARIVRRVPAGALVDVACQTSGTSAGGSRVWNKLTSGGWVADAYLSTPSRTGFSAPVPRCSTPMQVRTGANLRSGPGTTNGKVGALPTGALAFVECQRTGGLVGRSRVWDRLTDGRWIADSLVRSRSATSFSPNIPRC